MRGDELTDQSPSTTNLFAVVDALVRRAPDRVLYRDGAFGAVWTRDDFRRRAGAAGAALRARFGNSFAAGLLMGNRPDFFAADLAILAAGGVPVSLYPTSSAEQLRYVIDHAELKIVIADIGAFPALAQAIAGSAIDLVVCLDARHTAPLAGVPVLTFEELIGEAPAPLDFAEQADATEAGALATIIYTSGTTGRPKGVRLTHGNFLAAATGIGATLGLQEGDRAISWLPHAHVAERTCHYWCPLVFGLEITTCADAANLLPLVRHVQPDWFGAFPRLWEKLKIAAETELSRRHERSACELALADGLEAVRLTQARKPLPAALAHRIDQSDKAVMAPLRAALGLSRARALTTGSAPTPIHVHEFFASIGLPLSELYGASETATYGVMARPSEGMNIMGSAGVAAPGMALRTSVDGEIELRGPSVMDGYHRDGGATAEAISADGWYKTGDIGHIDAEGFLWITGRRKELAINASGHNMSPVLIENTIKAESALIAHVVAIADARPYVTALVVLDAEAAQRFAAMPASEFDSPAAHPGLAAHLAAAVAAGNARLARVEQIKRFRIIVGDWLPGGDELTPTLKIRRTQIMAKYAAMIDDLYAPTLLPSCLAPSMETNHD